MPYAQWILTACNECSNKEYGCSIRVFLVKKDGASSSAGSTTVKVLLVLEALLINGCTIYSSVMAAHEARYAGCGLSICLIPSPLADD